MASVKHRLEGLFDMSKMVQRRQHRSTWLISQSLYHQLHFSSSFLPLLQSLPTIILYTLSLPILHAPTLIDTVRVDDNTSVPLTQPSTKRRISLCPHISIRFHVESSQRSFSSSAQPAIHPYRICTYSNRRAAFPRLLSYPTSKYICFTPSSYTRHYPRTRLMATFLPSR
jgi:hypothetical protein